MPLRSVDVKNTVKKLNPAFYFPCGENAGALLQDVSGNARHMTAKGGVDFSPRGGIERGQKDRAIRSSGVGIGGIGAQQMTYSADTFPFTTMFTFTWDGNPAPDASPRYIWNKRQEFANTSTTGQAVYQSLLNGVQTLSFECNGSTGNAQLMQFAPILPFVPYHIVWTLNPGGVTELWINGVRINSRGLGAGMDATSNLPWTLGWIAFGANGSKGWVGGRVQDVALFPSVLPDLTIQYLYALEFATLRNGFFDYEGE